MPDGRFLAPVTKFVADRASVAAVYHLGVERWGMAFTRDLGRLIESYAGEQLASFHGGQLHGERSFGRGGGKMTVDWILVLPGLVLLIEVKSARVAASSRFTQAGFLDDIKVDVGKAFAQVNRTARLLAERSVTLADIPCDRPVRGIVVTAEAHHLVNSEIFRDGLPRPMVPTTVLSLEELEEAVGVAMQRDPSQVLLELTDTVVSGNRVNALLSEWSTIDGSNGPNNPILREAWDRYPFRDIGTVEP